MQCHSERRGQLEENRITEGLVLAGAGDVIIDRDDHLSVFKNVRTFSAPPT